MRVPVRAALAALAALGSLLAACSSSHDTSPSTPVGPPSASALQAFTHVTNLVTVSADIDGTTAIFGIDTGNPFLLLNPKSYPGSESIGAAKNVTIGPFSTANIVEITTSDVPASPDPAVTLGGLLGCAVICGNVATFDYQAGTFAVGKAAAPAPAPAGVGADVAVPFQLRGGGTSSFNGQPVTIPKSRVVVDVMIEGASHTLIVDTGASTITVNEALFDALTADGRATKSVGGVETTAGTSSESITRVKSVSLGGAEVDSPILAHDKTFDSFIQQITAETGLPIEGSLGGTFLANFFVTIDYVGSTVHLARYADTSFVIDEGADIGFTLTPSSGGGSYTVTKVTPGSDAAQKGVTAGDVVVAVDGQGFDGLTGSQVSVLFSGQVGTVRNLTFGSASTLGGQTVPVTFADVLPLAH